MGCMPKMARGKISSARGNDCCTNFLIPFARPASLYRERVNIYTYLTAYKLYMYYRCCQIKLPVKHFYTNQEQCDVLTGNLSLGRRSGGDWANTRLWKNVLQYSFQTGSSTSSPSYFQICFLVAFLEEVFIRNIIILL
jgi:hypothetical protein